MLFLQSCPRAINMKTFRIKVHNFLYAAAVGAVQPFYPLIAKHMGVSSSIFGLIMTTVAALTLFICPIMGWITTKLKKLKLILIILVIGQTPCYFLINYLPTIPSGSLEKIGNGIPYPTGIPLLLPLKQSNNTENSKIGNESLEPYTSEFIEQDFNKSNGTIPSQTEHANKRLSENIQFLLAPSKINMINVLLQYQFWLLLTFTCLAFVTTNVNQSLSNAVCCKILEGRYQDFGKLKLWDSFGMGSTVLATGYLIDLINAQNDGKTVDYSICFYIMILFIVADIITLKMIHMDEITSSNNILRDVTKIFTKPHPFVFTSAVFIIGLFHGLKLYYSPWLLEETGLKKWQLGLISTVKCFGEVISFNFGQIATRIGRDNSVCCFLLTFASWYLTVCYIPEFLLIVFGCFIEGICYGIFYASMSTYANAVAPIGTEVTMQSILCAMFYGFGIGAGSLLGGIGFEYFDGTTTFRFCGFSAFLIALLYKCITIFVADQTSSSRTNEVNANNVEIIVISEDGIRNETKKEEIENGLVEVAIPVKLTINLEE